MDYKILLAKYIKHVGDCEGISFIPHGTGDVIRWTNPSFTQEEIDELQKLEKSVEQEE